MSEFSESYHLRSSDAEEAVQILRKAERKGFVFPAENGWVSFVAEEGTFAPDQAIVQANTGRLLHYVWTEDHGWSFAIFEASKQILAYSASWDPEVEVDKSQFDEEKFKAFVSENGTGSVDDILPLLDLDPDDEEGGFIEDEPAKILAQVLGLPHYDWLDYDHVESDPEEYEDLIAVE